MGRVGKYLMSPCYSYFEGVSFDRGVEKIGWVQADVKMAPVDDVMVPSVSNYDHQKNLDIITVSTGWYPFKKRQPIIIEPLHVSEGSPKV